MKVLDHTDNPLSHVLAEALNDPPELPRLTVAQTFVHYQRLALAIENAGDELKRIPTAQPDRVTECLKDIVRQCEIAIKTAQRMLEGNR